MNIQGFYILDYSRFLCPLLSSLTVTTNRMIFNKCLVRPCSPGHYSEEMRHILYSAPLLSTVPVMFVCFDCSVKIRDRFLFCSVNNGRGWEWHKLAQINCRMYHMYSTSAATGSHNNCITLNTIHQQQMWVTFYMNNVRGF